MPPDAKSWAARIGYEFLLSRIPLRMPPLERPAQVRPVTRIERISDLLAVPRQVAPAEDASLLEHVLFALKHEDTRLGILHEALKQVPADGLVRSLATRRSARAPTSTEPPLSGKRPTGTRCRCRGIPPAATLSISSRPAPTTPGRCGNAAASTG